ncbi:HAMP domain-containing sensor histidine kinase [Persicobacter psychrovividus]|uniref:histidine kinase n=1 Tax=Persicobacter psychrovividus TaxID=387638 RepID=A0ABM7VL83_9BACT|nr:two-component sensor histidine kinase [Persicobacter psychrovividus]
MKIRLKIALNTTLLFSVLLALILGGVYYITQAIIEVKFYERLEQRVQIVSKIYFEKDELEATIYADFAARYLKKLPEEIDQIFDDQMSPVLPPLLPEFEDMPFTFNNVREQKVVQFSANKRLYVAKYKRDNTGEYIVVVCAQDSNGEQYLSTLWLIMLFSYLVSLVTVMLTSWFFAEKVLRPINSVIRGVGNITTSNLEERLPEGNGKDEIAQLANSFNGMLDRIQEGFQQQKSFVSNASHELRTPLTALIGELEVMLMRERSVEEYHEGVSTALIRAKSLREIINQLLTLAKTSEGLLAEKLVPVRLDELIFEIQMQHPQGEIKLDFWDMPEDADDMEIMGNEGLLRLAIGNLAENALKYSQKRPVEIQYYHEGPVANIRIIDKGIGIDPEDVRKVTQPFYRSQRAKDFAPGNGIGLALAAKIIAICGGRLELSSKVGEGTTAHCQFKMKK